MTIKNPAGAGVRGGETDGGEAEGLIDVQASFFDLADPHGTPQHDHDFLIPRRLSSRSVSFSINEYGRLWPMPL